MIPTPDWHAPATLSTSDQPDRTGALAELVFFATRLDRADRPDYLLVCDELGEVDGDQLEELRRRPDFPEAF